MKRIAVALMLLTAVPAGATAATQWLPQTVVVPQARGVGTPAVAGNDDGRAVAAWASSSGVVTSLRTPGGPWYSPTRLPGSGRGASGVNVAMGAGGQAAVVWVENGRVRASIRQPRGRFLAATTVSAAGRVATTPVVALGGACAPLVAWSAESTRGGSATIESACANARGRFSPVRSVSAADDDAFTPALAASSGGSVVVWRSDVADQHRMRAAVRQRDGSFATPVDVSPISTSVYLDPSVAMSPIGEATATWTAARGNDLMAQASSLPMGGTWTRPDDISRTGGVARGAHVAVDTSGNAVAAWVRGGTVQVATRAPGQSWGQPADLSNSAVTAGTPRLAMSGSGAALVTWPAAEGSTYVAQAALRNAGGAFGAPTTISNPAFPALALAGVIGDSGVAPVVWQWAAPGTDPAITASGIASATGFAGSDQPGPAILVDLRARPASVQRGQRVTVTFGLSQPSRVRLSVTPQAGGREVSALSVSGADGANAITLEGRLGGASLGRGRWRITATPRAGISRNLVLVVR